MKSSVWDSIFYRRRSAAAPSLPSPENQLLFQLEPLESRVLLSADPASAALKELAAGGSCLDPAAVTVAWDDATRGAPGETERGAAAVDWGGSTQDPTSSHAEPQAPL